MLVQSVLILLDAIIIDTTKLQKLGNCQYYRRNLLEN